ncbi:MAG: methyltransferase domain-containing protein [Methylophilaceae bacterium]|nr:MAG: methyltransferase domain-containing protein [Methylophilaceae bacterium]
MKLIKRDHCVVTGNSDLEFLHGIDNFPIFMGCVNSPKTEDVEADMNWSISRGSGLIQLNNLIPLAILYPESHGSGGIGTLWDKHHKAFAHFLNRSSPSSVLEVGGAHGILAREYQQFGKIPWTILEPNPTPCEGCEARFIRGFFDEKFSYREAFDTVVHSHVFEHIYEPDQFMRHLAGFMAEGKHLVFSLPNMQIMLERKYTNCINFEHTTFLTEPYVEFLLVKHGFRLLSKEYFMDDHSIFYAAVRDPSVGPADLPHGLYEKNKRLYMDYVRYHEELIKDLNRKMSDFTQPVYLFGAHVFAQHLIMVGLDTTRIISLLDNDPQKQGKRLYGTSLMVQSPEKLREVKNPIVILKAGVYSDEIKSDIIRNINPETIFLE